MTDGLDGPIVSGGLYVLAITVSGDDDRVISVGALGESRVPAGRYAYVGSALGPGGFARIDRHREVATGHRDVRHWHVDYVLGAEGVDLDNVHRLPGQTRECELAGVIPGEPIAEFGASDCGCEAHLRQVPSDGALTRAIRGFRAARTSE